MKGWEQIKERQADIVKFLTNSYQKDRLVHAYILEGAKGVGKLSVAKNFAKMLLCESQEKICGNCRHCKMIENDGHVNVFHIVADGKTIKKEQIAFLQTEFSKVAAEDGAKVYIIEDADKMSLSAANSLLKSLEEPSAATYVLLLTQNKEKLLPTIRSRSVLLPFKKLGMKELIEQYKEVGINQYAEIVAALTQNVAEARALSESTLFTSLMELVLQAEALNLDASILIAKNQELFKKPEAALLYLKLYMIYYQDVLNMKLGKTQNLCYHLNLESLKTSEKVNSVSDCTKKLTKLMQAENKILANANTLLCLEQLFLEMKGALNDAI